MRGQPPADVQPQGTADCTAVPVRPPQGKYKPKRRRRDKVNLPGFIPSMLLIVRTRTEPCEGNASEQEKEGQVVDVGAGGAGE